MQFRVLGPLEVDAGDGPIPLGGPKQRAVLANLLIRANQVVPADVLIGDVWGDESPEKARHILQTYVSNLRRTLGDGRLEGRPSGYLLVVEPSELDSLRFDDLVSNAKKALPVDPNVAISTLEDALAIWRGPALADLTDQPSLLAEAARLDELRIDAQEDRVEGLLATGEHSRALGELEPLLARHPLRESLWGLAMLANYRQGRQADALNAFGRARELLADELGIDPSPELVRLHERILKQDPSLDLRGEPLRGYRLLEKIGTGPSGAVFRGIQPRVGRDVSVKVFDERISAAPEFVARFEREAQAIAALEHPHIVPLYDYWREPGRGYLVSRYMRGGSLRGLTERGGPPERDRALRIVGQIASALGFAHRQGVAHGGVGPSNVLLDTEGNAYLGDFRVGAEPKPDRDADLRELRRWARDLLGTEIPAALAEVVEDTPDAETAPDGDAIAEVTLRVLDPRSRVPVEPREERNPYKGLRPFSEADAVDFFGRAELTERLVARLNEPEAAARFLAVVGPSGGGKSSIVRAGLVPAIRRGALASRDRVLVADLFPGARPLDELESALVRVAARPPTRVGDLIAEGTRGLLEAVELVTPEDTELVLVVDQFEELFTLTSDPREREHFLESLRVAAVDPSSRLRVIVTLRADFYDRPLVYQRFGELLADRTVTVPPLTPDELEQAIRRPAERQGMQLETGLVAEMIADVAHQPGGLPLLQYALTELFERREANRLTVAAYREIGGVTGALSARADRLYAGADADGRRAIEQVFLRLVTLGEGRQDTRRRVALGELDALDVPDEAVGTALDGYGRHRLLTFDREPATRDPTVEIAHEALLRAWDRLAGWIDHAREDIRQNERLSRAGAEWRGYGEDASFLMTGARLDQVEAWARTTGLSIGRPERVYLRASLIERDRIRLEEQARRDREAQVERRSVRRLRGLVAVFAIAALVAGSLTIVATNQGGRAEREATTARARELVAASIANLTVDPELSILLAIQAIEETRSKGGSPLPEAEDALHRAVAASRVTMTLRGAGGPVAWGGGGLIATTGSEGAGLIEIRDITTGDLVRTIDAGAEVTDLGFGDGGRLLAATTEDGSLEIWNPGSGRTARSVTGNGRASGVSFDAGGSLVSAAWPKDDTVRVIDTSTWDVTKTLRIREAFETALRPDGRQIAVSRYGFGDHHPPAVVVSDLRTGDAVLEPLIPTTGIALHYVAQGVAWSPDGRWIASASAFLDIWDAKTGENAFSRFVGVDSVAWAPDSSRLVTGSSTGHVSVWVMSAFDPVGELDLASSQLLGGIAPNGVAFSPDGTQVIAGSVDAVAVKIWDVGLRGNAEWGNLPTAGWYSDVTFTPDGRLITTQVDGAVAVVDPVTGAVESPIRPPIDFEQAFDLSPDGRSIAFAYSDRVTAWDVESRDLLFSYDLGRGHWANRVDWSPDGRFLAVPDESGGSGVTILDRVGGVVTVVPSDSASVARFSPDGRLIAVGEYDRVRLWDWERGELVRSFPATGWDLAYDPTGAAIVTNGDSGDGGPPEIWDVRTGTRRATLGQAGEVMAVAFSPDGSRVATGGADDTVRLFDAMTGDPLLVFDGFPAGVRGLAFSADGSKLAAHSPTLVRIFSLDIDELTEIAERNVTRSLTDAECRRYLHLERCPADLASA